MKHKNFKELGMNVIHADNKLGYLFTWTKESLFLWSLKDEDDWRVSANLSQFTNTSELCSSIRFCQSLCEVTKMDSVIDFKSHKI